MLPIGLHIHDVIETIDARRGETESGESDEAAHSADISMMAPPKNSGTKTKKFFTHWRTLMMRIIPDIVIAYT